MKTFAGSPLFGAAASSIFRIEDIRALLSLLHHGKSCTEARRLAESRLVELRRRRVELQVLESTIASLVTAYANTCDGGGAPDCEILQAPRKGRPHPVATETLTFVANAIRKVPARALRRRQKPPRTYAAARCRRPQDL